MQLVSKYRAYIEGEAERSLAAAKQALASISITIRDLKLSELERRLAQVSGVSAGVEEPSQIVEKTKELLRDSAPWIEHVKAYRQVPDPAAMLEKSESVRVLSKSRLVETNEVVSALRSKGEERQEAYAQESAKLHNLEDRITLMRLYPEIKSYVEDSKWAAQAKTILRKRFPPLLRSLTESSKVASEDLMNQDFERLFNEECKALRAPKVALQFPGRKGKPARRKTLVKDHRLSDILSEGEQNVIALADFLAEVSILPSPATVVLDDPVTSLDYRRLDHIVDRLSSLSLNHQVIVFTHNIWFATGLLARFEKSPNDCSYYDISVEDEQPGIVRGGKHPRWDTPKKLRGRINDTIQIAASESGEVRQAMIERSYSMIRAWCEAVAEQELLAGVARRFQPNVMMTNLRQINVGRLSDAIEAISDVFEKACRVTEAHSQPLETQHIQPTLLELQADWSAAQAARDRYIQGY